jgi:hypothetical protein
VVTDPPWDGQEGAALKKFLKANPTITREQWTSILDNRTRSPGINHAARLSEWINRRALSWLNGPADDWGKPLTGGTANGRSSAQLKQDATIAAFDQYFAKLKQSPQVDSDAEMAEEIAAVVMTGSAVTTKWAREPIAEQAKIQMQINHPPPEELCFGMIHAWKKYRLGVSEGKVTTNMKAEVFFGEGRWRASREWGIKKDMSLSEPDHSKIREYVAEHLKAAGAGGEHQP